MILGDSLKRYIPQIKEAVFDYAYANYHMEPVLEEVDIEYWVGERWNVSDMEKYIHEDIIADLKTLNMYDTIKQRCDKFVILPDVWSKSEIPITGPRFPRNQYDTDRRNVVILNGRIMDLKDVKMKSIWYNHNRLLYCFYKDSLSDGIFDTPEGQTPTMKVLWLYEHGFMINNIKGNEDKWNIVSDDPKWFKFMLDENNKVTTDETIDRVGIALDMHHIVFDYETDVDPRVEVHIPGMESFGKDTWIRPKWYNMEDENRVFIHNTHVLFSNTFIIFYKDRTYKICNTYLKEIDGGIEKIDKHTVRMEKDPNIAKIVLFVRPYQPGKYPPPDSLYYKAVAENRYSCLWFKKYKKYTNDLYYYMTKTTKEIDFGWILNYGYKYDADILKVIQSFFKTVVELNPLKDVDYVLPNAENKFIKPKIIVRTLNQMQRYPLLFINDRLYPADYRIMKADDNDLLVLDPEQLFKLMAMEQPVVKHIPRDNRIIGTKINDYEPPIIDKDNYLDTDWIKKNFERLVERMTVVFSGYNYLDDEIQTRQGGRIFRTPVYKQELILDEVGDQEARAMFRSFNFVNGCLNNEKFDNTLLRRLDGVNPFDFGPLTFKVTASDDPTSSDVYDIDSIVVPEGLAKTVYNNDKTTLLLNRTTDKLIGMNKVYFDGVKITHVCHYEKAGEMDPIDPQGRLKEHNTVVFDKYGYLCTRNVDILSSKYSSCDNMYNYVSGNGLEDNIVVHFFPTMLRDRLRGYDLEIDPTRISKEFNSGFFNDNAMEDKYVKALFLPNEPDHVKPIPVTLKSNKILLGQKILTRYWLSSKGTIFNKEQFSTEVAGLNGKFVNTDGSIGDIPAEFNDFVTPSTLRDETTPLLKFMVSKESVYNMFVGYGITYVNYNDNFVDSNIEYSITMTDLQDAHTKDNILTLHIDNDMFITKEEKVEEDPDKGEEGEE